MSNIGKRVKIKDYSYYPEYEGKVGEIVKELNSYYDVRMPDGYVISPYKPSMERAQCEFIEEKTEEMKKYTIEQLNTRDKDDVHEDIVVHIRNAQEHAKLKTICPNIIGYENDRPYYLAPSGCSSSKPYYTTIEFEQIIFPEEEKAFPEKWTIRGSEELRGWVNKYDNSHPGNGITLVGNSTSLFYYTRPGKEFNNWTTSSERPIGYEEVSFEQFEEHFNTDNKKSTPKVMKGYKIKDEKYRSTLYQITNTQALASFYKGENEYLVKRFTDLGVLDVWFEEIDLSAPQVGDWYAHYGTYDMLDVAVEIVRIDEGGSRLWMLNKKGEEVSSTVTFLKEGFTKATPEQIAKAKQDKENRVVISGYVATVNSCGVSFGCQDIHIDDLKALHNLLNRGGFEFKASVNGTDLTYSMIIKLLSLYAQSQKSV